MHKLALLTLLALATGILANPKQCDANPKPPKDCDAGEATGVNIDSKNKNKNLNKVNIGNDGSAFVNGKWVSGGKNSKEELKKDSRQCSFYLPFDDTKDITKIDAEDQSAFKRKVKVKGTWSLMNDTSDAAHGRGAIYLNHGEIVVPSLKIFECGKQTTLCFFVRCENCEHGTIFSNRDDEDCSGSDSDREKASRKFSMTVEILKNRDFPTLPGVRVTAGFKHHKATVQDFMPFREYDNYGTSLPFGYQQFCVMYDGKNVTITNQANYKTERVDRSGRLRKTNNPSRFGNDAKGGWFSGWLDEILVCDRVLSWKEINAHFGGRLAMEAQGMVPKTWTYYDYITEDPVGPSGSTPVASGICGHSEIYNIGENLIPTVTGLGIVGGREAVDFEFPSMVLFQTTENYYHCHGTLMSGNKVVTSGLCCLRMQADGLPKIRAYLGVTKTGFKTIVEDRTNPSGLFSGVESYTEVRGVAGVTKHHNYLEEIIQSNWNSTTVNRTRSARYFHAQHNLCVVTLDTAVALDSWRIQPACLADCGCSCESGDYGLVAGFGQTAYNEWDWSFMADKLQVISIPMISDYECKASLNRWYPTANWYNTPVNMGGNFCAGFVNKGINQDACYGDDGTAFFCTKKGYFSLRGVLSGWDCSSTPGSPSQFTDLCDASNGLFVAQQLGL